jgi:hypothetical protein
MLRLAPASRFHAVDRFRQFRFSNYDLMMAMIRLIERKSLVSLQRKRPRAALIMRCNKTVLR